MMAQLFCRHGWTGVDLKRLIGTPVCLMLTGVPLANCATACGRVVAALRFLQGLCYKACGRAPFLVGTVCWLSTFTITTDQWTKPRRCQAAGAPLLAALFV
jgi:hypothetical protein